MSKARGRLARLARLHGIQGSHTDLWRQRHVVPAATKRALLAAMGVPAANPDEVEHSLAMAEDFSWRRPLPPVVVTRKPAPIAWVTLPSSAQGKMAWSVSTEGGDTTRGEVDLGALEVVARGVSRGETFERHALQLPDLPAGYHRLDLSHGEAASTTLVVAPEQAYGGADPSERLWGVMAPLYGVRSSTSWGIGDLADLGQLAESCGQLGAAFLGINPLHAQRPAVPEQYSPYSPSSRQFLNVVMIAVEQVPELKTCEAAQRLLSSANAQSTIGALRSAPMIDYPAVAALKFEVLGLLFADLANSPARLEEFEAFRHRSGSGLQQQALFDALFEHFRGQDPACTTWRNWPLPYQNPASPEVARFAAEHHERIAFFAYLQWLAEQQLEQAQRQAGAAMALGLYLDLAVGVTADGAEAWAHRDWIAQGASLGAPPDQFSPDGQNWALAPLSPRRLRELAYGPLIAILRSAMAHAGIIRIDHVLGLQRSFWWPEQPGLPGGYVRQPVEDLLGIVALESHRQQCMVIGEDLGTVPAGLRKILAATGVLGCSVLYFERDGAGDFLPPSRYRANSIASIGTHDLPTLAGFWAGRDIDWRAELGLYNGDQAAHARTERHEDRCALLRLLADEGLLPEGVGSDAPPENLPWPLVVALHRLLARAPARLVALQIEDALGVVEQANLPGTIDAHPNWRRRLAASTEELDRSPALKELGEAVARERPPPLY
ncbi:MAG: 4-alpha-glucanotransferase [Pseudomonadota bacterium]